MITAVDSSVLIDVLEPDPVHGPASAEALRRCLREGALVACEVVWAEVGGTYSMAGAVARFERLGVGFSSLDIEAALAAGSAWNAYRARGGTRARVSADFLIGAHASLRADRLLTRDRGFYREYFADLEIVDPQS